MKRFGNKILSRSSALIAAIFTLLPESFFQIFVLLPHVSTEVNIVVCRVLVSLLVIAVTAFLYLFYLHRRRSVTIEGDNWVIEVKYGDINSEKDCKRIIGFDECFTSKVGDAKGEIRASSVCGQYLKEHPELHVDEIVAKSGLEPLKSLSRFQDKRRYPLGSIIPYGDDLLFAFASLNVEGRAEFTSREEYLECLDNLWCEVDKYYAGKDVCIPIFGTGATRFSGGFGESPNQQKMLDFLICSYKMSSHKIKRPQKLRIVCKPQEGFSINKIDGL